MRLQKALVGTALLYAMLMATTAFATPVSFNFTNITGATLRFASGSFHFPDAYLPGNVRRDIQITSGPLAGLLGKIDGLYAIGPITINGGTESAPVTGVGAFRIYDPSSSSGFVADLVWNDIFTLGSGGGINFGATINLSNASYTGTNSTLLDLRDNGDGVVQLSFQFTPARTLTVLKASTSMRSFDVSGTLESGTADVPEPGSLLLIGSGLLSLVAIRRRKSL